MKAISEILSFFEDLLFPSKCGGCGKYGEILCQNCLLTFEPTDRELPKNIYSVFNYRSGLIKKVIWNIKYKNNKKLVKNLGSILAIHSLEEIDVLQKMYGGKFVVVCIPGRKKGIRVFNQAFILADEVAKKNNLPLIDCLYFSRSTENQARIRNKKLRMKNIENSMSVKEKFVEILKNKNILLIDDIITTGATIQEARRTLKSVGVRKVFAFTLAH